MTSINQQIITSFEDLGMTPEEIAGEQELEVLAVKATLLQYSPKYRRAAKTDNSLNFNEDEEKRINNILMQIAEYAEDDNTRLKAAIFIKNERRGRNDIAQTPGISLNFNLIQEQMAKAAKAIDKSKAVEITNG